MRPESQPGNEALDRKISRLEAQQANGDESRLTKLRLTGLYVLREKLR